MNWYCCAQRIDGGRDEHACSQRACALMSYGSSSILYKARQKKKEEGSLTARSAKSRHSRCCRAKPSSSWRSSNCPLCATNSPHLKLSGLFFYPPWSYYTAPPRNLSCLLQYGESDHRIIGSLWDVQRLLIVGPIHGDT